MTGECEHLRDDLPLHAAGRLAHPAVQRVEAHLQECAACRAEHALVLALRAPLPAPAELHARVRRASIVTPRRVPTFARFALAAGLVTIIAGGALVLARPDGPGRAATNPVDADGASELGWAARMDPLLDGGPGLAALSVEELELLLEEMQS